MNSLMLLWKVLLEEFGEWCGTSTILDLKKAEKRFNHEGLSFLTITLPDYCTDFEKSLEQGQVSPDLFMSFHKKASLPLFLGGFLDLVFDRGTGRLLEDPDIDSIFAIRHLTAFFKKIEIPCSKSRESLAIEGYLQCEKDVKDADKRISDEDRSDLLRMSALLFRDVFTLVDRDIHEFNIMGKHGPGKTADRNSGNQKYDLSEWPARLEAEFPYGNEAVPNPGFNYLYERVAILEPGEERPVKVTLVPKTLKTPRIIAIEPTAMQYMQQGLMEKFVKYLEIDKTVSGMIGFTDQIPNQDLAREGSLYRELATLDLKEASDRVSNQHVRALLQRFPTLQRAVESVRSRKAVIPGGPVIRLAKFASMGSALTFPFEAMVFLTLVFLGIEKELNRPLTRKDFKVLSNQVRVYGDDIVVPVRFVSSVVRVLDTFGYKVNTGKSFWNGKFRESCGKEYFDGVDVSITRVRRLLPTQLTDRSEKSRSERASSIISTVALRNQLYVSGLWQTAEYLDRILSSVMKNWYPVLNLDSSSIAYTGKVGNGSPILGRQSVFSYEAEWADCDLHIPLVRGWHVSSEIPMNAISGEGALLKWFVKRGEQPFANVNHLERSGRPNAVSIKLGWKSPF